MAEPDTRRCDRCGHTAEQHATDIPERGVYLCQVEGCPCVSWLYRTPVEAVATPVTDQAAREKAIEAAEGAYRARLASQTSDEKRVAMPAAIEAFEAALRDGHSAWCLGYQRGYDAALSAQRAGEPTPDEVERLREALTRLRSAAQHAINDPHRESKMFADGIVGICDAALDAARPEGER